MRHVVNLCDALPDNSKTNIRRNTKIGRIVPHDTRSFAHQFQSQKAEVQGHRPINAGTKMCHIFRTERPTNSNLVYGWTTKCRISDNARTSKVKCQGHN